PIVTNDALTLYVLCKDFAPTHHHSGALCVLSTLEIGWAGRRRNVYRYIGRLRAGPYWRGRHVSRSHIQEVVQRLRREDRRENQLPGDWLRRRHQTVAGADRRLRRFRRS